MKNKQKIINFLLSTSSRLNKKILLENKNLINDGYLDSFNIVKLISEKEKKNKKKLLFVKLTKMHLHLSRVSKNY